MKAVIEKNCWIDIDDTIAQSLSEMLSCGVQYLERRFRTASWRYDVETEDDLYFADILQLEEIDISLYFEEYYPEYLERIVPTIGAKRFLEVLKSNGFIINLISARKEKEGYNVKQLTSNWLQKNGLQYDTLTINCMDKSMYLKNKTGIFIDDCYKNCKSVSEKTELCVIQKRTPFSKKCNSVNVTQKDSWEEILRFILCS